MGSLEKAAGYFTMGLAAAVAAGSGYLASFTARGRRQTLDESLAWQRKRYDAEWYFKLPREDYTVVSFDGYVLHVQLCRAREPSDRYVILTHGYTDNRMGSLKYMKLYLDRGYNCIIYDLRGHGVNREAVCTYSVREGKDLYELVRDTLRRYPDLKVLGLHGESLGAAATASVLGYGMWARADGLLKEDLKELAPDLPVDFAVCDCGFAEIGNVLEGALQGMMNSALVKLRIGEERTPGGEKYSRPSPLAKFVVGCTSAASAVLYRYSYGDMKPIRSLGDNRVPVLFLHGEQDTFIPPENSRRMAAATAGYSEYHLIPGAGHAQSVLAQPELYRKYLYGFLDHVGC